MADVLNAVGIALGQIADPFRFMMIICGVLMGLVTGIVPGLGGLVGITLLLPFTFHMDPHTALGVLIGMHAVVATSDSIPAILFGVPGTVGSAATVLDGYPMSKRGEAGRALGAAFTSSLLGGIYGALLLAIFIPVMRPFMLAIGSPEMLMFCVFGLSLAAVLSGKHMLRGLTVACLGLLLSMVGEDYQSGTMRWTFDTLYLWEGIPLIPVALGLFAIPELADLVIRRVSIAGSNKIASNQGQLKGFWDVIHNPVTLLRSATIGAVFGAMPGLGAAVIDWLAYGSAAKSKGGEGLGSGDVRGVIASEAANNAKEGGSLVPTVAFGVPGSAHMAILLGAFLMQGIVPGPDLLGKHLDITYTLILSLAIANIVGAGLCFAFAPQLAKIALVPIGFLAPLVLAITFMGAFQGDNAWGDLFSLVAAGALGYLMRLFGWPRPPLLLGFVLGSLIERYMATSIQIFGTSFLSRPIVIIMIILTAWGLLSPLWAALIKALRGKGNRMKLSFGLRRENLSFDTVFAAVFFALFAAAVVNVTTWPLGARLAPQIVAVAGVIVSGLYILTRLFVSITRAQPESLVEQHMDLKVDRGELTTGVFAWRAISYFLWLIGYVVLAMLIGPVPALGLWVAAYTIIDFKIHPLKGIITALAIGGFAYLVFTWLLNTPWPASVWRF